MRAEPDEPIEEMFVIARYVGITGDQLRRLLGVMSLCAIKLTNDQPAAAPAPVDGLVERLRICAFSMEDVANTKNIEGWATLLEHVDVIRAAAAALQSSDEPVAHCNWELDVDDGIWVSACGKQFLLNDGTPAENSMKYCHGCGKILRHIATTPRKP